MLSFLPVQQSPTKWAHQRIPRRRAEYAQSFCTSNEENDQLRRSHSSRTEIQLALYQFALEVCFGLIGTDNFGDRASSIHVYSLLDLGCGNSANGSLPLMKLIPTSLAQLTIGVDLFANCSNSLAMACINCDLTRTSDQRSVQLTPFRDHVFDYIVSISFLQWLMAKNMSHVSSELLSRFSEELFRILSQPDDDDGQYGHGQCVLQFYPSGWTDVDSVCNSLFKANPKLKGCRILAQPVANRGIKLFLYMTVSNK
ncbi:hypothetical protein FBUS_06116 [Fasciolopsis buskii]|uniref:Methyltransferase type 11 domain-containing protein n=1 Tax=Fasciolopsis buskii TaxID=27845 RepID=A0A8E0S2Y1_9TREM|nr:hypothetical protein FBUS_06116 [Fasciolopsis buski]